MKTTKPVPECICKCHEVKKHMNIQDAHCYHCQSKPVSAWKELMDSMKHTKLSPEQELIMKTYIKQVEREAYERGFDYGYQSGFYRHDIKKSKEEMLDVLKGDK